jgi:CHASE2 domain-containing sensor protein/tetratricopeptide (TPR) repeat protein
MKTPLWKRHWVAGLLTVVLVLSIHSCTTLVDGLERYAYDVGVRGSERSPQDNIAILAIDEPSIENIGRWPWSRDIHAEMISKLTEAGAKVIAYTPIFAEPQIDHGLQYINDLVNHYRQSGLSQQPTEGTAPNLFQQHERLVRGNSQALNSLAAIKKPVAEMETLLLEAQSTLNADRILVDSMVKAGNVASPMWFLFGEPLGNPDTELPEFVRKLAIQNIEDTIGATELGSDFLPLQTFKAITPISEIGIAAVAVGNINNYPDVDGGIRTEPLVIDYYDTYFPSYALLIAARSLNLNVNDITVKLGEGVQLGRLNIGTDSQLKMLTFFYQDQDGNSFFPIDSFFDVLTGKVPVSKYKDKIVIVGSTASGIGNPQLTPIDANMSEAETLAHTVASILNENFFIAPGWTLWAKLAFFCLIALYIMLVLPKLKAQTGAIVSGGLLAALFTIHYILMTQQAIWLELMLPVTLLVTGYLILTTQQFLLTERGKLHSDLESAESNKMLGLAFQGQGQLDMAFEKFRKCPKDDGTSESMYNLALDYERKRQFSKAGNVYQYIAEFNPKFRDVEQRIARSKKMEDTIVLGGKSGSSASGTLILEGGEVEKPMLGRYQIEKELGKGAMGVVYLGRDPKISRVVAIKTMALSQEFDEDELVEVKERFFREAETAGRLNHPNIVTIYDAGEEHDLAYIAMEFLKGKDMARYTKKDALLPVKTVLQIVQKAADALHYAHNQNVVHRDIKPANIMYDPESGELKITDFGIARITDSSKTKTGVVLGTPSYMSPEQLAGKKVDGRSDLFSMGVMLFQMLSGQLPFQADSMATLMFKIANETHPSVMEINPDLPPILEVIVARALEKKAEDRFQNGAEMAQALGQCLQQLG